MGPFHYRYRREFIGPQTLTQKKEALKAVRIYNVCYARAYRKDPQNMCIPFYTLYHKLQAAYKNRP